MFNCSECGHMHWDGQEYSKCPIEGCPCPHSKTTQAHDLGYEAGKAASSWLLDGNSTEAAARALLDGIRDGDPEIMNQLPSNPLSGEWAGGTTQSGILEELEVDEDDDWADEVIDAYEDGFSTGAQHGAEGEAMRFLGIEPEEVAPLTPGTAMQIGRARPYAWPGCYPIAYLCDDGDVLCHKCVNDEMNPVHVGGDADGWRLEGHAVFEGEPEDYGCTSPDGIRCAVCDDVILGPTA